MISTVDTSIQRFVQPLTGKLSRLEIIRVASLVGVVANVLLATLKLLAGIISNSLSIISDAINNYTDALSSIIALIGINLSQKKADHDHPLGYGRIEYVSSLIVSILVVVAGVELFREVIGRFSDPQVPQYESWHIITLLLLVAGKFFFSRFTLVCGKMTHYDALVASGEEGKLDVYVSSLTIFAAILSKMIEWPYIDPLVGLLLSLFIFYTGIKLVSESSENILGKRPSKSLVEEIKALVTSHAPIMGAYDVVLHSYGPSLQLGSLNVELPDTTSVAEAYKAMMDAQADVYQKYKIYLTIGLYSINTADQAHISLRREVTELVLNIHGALSLHAFTYNPEQHFAKFDVVVAFSVTDFQSFENRVLSALRQKFPGITFAINLDLDYS